ncbi:MAG: TIGR03960 family B12-binding radical SAM protein [Desulfurivibrio sp.]
MKKMDFDSLLTGISRPGRYCGNEFNVVKKDWEQARLRLALIFPDLYEIGMSHQGLQILYHLVNARPQWLAERAYAPDLDLEAALRQAGLPLFSLESRRPLADFDLLGISLPYELCYSNILTILDLAGLPLRAAERDERHPLVIGGGPCAFHPEPVVDFFDLILLGDGEEALPEILALVERGKLEGRGRSELLAELAGVEGVYVPSFFLPRYDEQGYFLGIDNLRPELPAPRRRVLADLDAAASSAPPLVPATRIVHDRLGVEIARGCTRGCRFCQAGIIYRPVRERDPEKVLAETLRKLEESGFDEVALLSLSSGDYACINDLLIRLMDALAARRVSLSLPSMRVGTLTREMMEQIRRVRKTGFTLAPEAGSERLRRVINKGITEEDLLTAAASAFTLGWQVIKLYFMFGLPTETEEDMAAIPELAAKVLRTGGGGRGQVTVSSAIFVPKPHTPFEREPQLGIAEGFARIDFLKEKLRNKKFKLKWHDPRQSFLEGVFCRGDRRLGALLEKAWRAGARLDAWSDHFRLERWQEAATELGLDLEAYLRRRRADEPLPWDHLDVGVERRFLVEEYQKALEEEYTPDCRVHGCAKCGLCDFKKIKPVVFRQWEQGEKAKIDPPSAAPPLAVGYRFIYARRAEARLLGHLEILQIFFRAFRRAGWPLAFTQGFNPSPKVSFGPALPLGTESLAEFLWLELTRPLADPEKARVLLNQQLPAGLEVISLQPGGRGQAARQLSAYRITLPAESLRKFIPRAAADLLAAGEFVMTVPRKGLARKIDARPAIDDCVVRSPDEVELVLVQEASRPTVKPLEVVAACFALAPADLAAARVLKLWSKDAE